MTTAQEDAELLDLYARELSYLRERGAEFAAAYPKIAARLGLEGRHCSDPHVERLLESFAFLTARLQHRLDGDLPELTTSLLGVLYPPLQSPIPSMAIAAYEVKPRESKLTSGLVIERHTPLFVEARGGGPTCRFRTCYPVTLWPIAVESAGLVAPEKLTLPAGAGAGGVLAALQIQLKSGPPLGALGPKRLRFYLGGGGGMAGYRLYEMLFGHTLTAFVADAQGRYVAPAHLHPVGFDPDEAAIPYPVHAHPAHRLLQEYFSFPEKFLFCDVELGGLPEGDTLQIVILLDQRPPGSLVVRPDTFLLGCTPIINLFPRTTEPIRVDGRYPEYRLIADARRERTTEIHSIQRVTATAPGEAEQIDYEPFFSFTHHRPGAGPRAFWHARRVVTHREDVPGTDVLLTFVDTRFKPTQPPSRAVYASVLCTNRDLPEEMSAGVRLMPERGAAVGTTQCLTKPTPQRDPPLHGQALWRLVSNLSLNHLSLSGPRGLDALREILRVYLPDQIPDAERQIQGITEISARTVARRIGRDAWRGFCRGTEITLTFDEEQFVGQSPLLFAEVLGRFLSLYAHINTFTQLVLKSASREEEWKRWPPMAGAKPLL